MAPPNDGNGAVSASVPIRMIHPLNGVFDIVVVHTSSSDALAEAKRLLSGSPIYSVYLKVGTPKEWMLQYCEAREVNRTSGRVVQLGVPTRLMSPFPKLTVVPPLSVIGRLKKTILRGFLTPLGEFRDLKPVEAEDAEFHARIAPFLQQWEFRPAMRDGRPIEIELLLIIPVL